METDGSFLSFLFAVYIPIVLTSHLADCDGVSDSQDPAFSSFIWRVQKTVT